MWAIREANGIVMTEGDFGVELPIVINGTTLTAGDEIRVTIKKQPNSYPILTKTYANIEQNTIAFELTEAESALLPVGAYVYSLDWYQNHIFMCNIIPCSAFRVVDKA